MKTYQFYPIKLCILQVCQMVLLHYLHICCGILCLWWHLDNSDVSSAFCYSFHSRRGRRVSVYQLELLWEFLNADRGIATAYNRSLHDKHCAKKKWIEIAAALNAQDDGSYKDWRGWSKVIINLNIWFFLFNGLTS